MSPRRTAAPFVLLLGGELSAVMGCSAPAANGAVSTQPGGARPALSSNTATPADPSAAPTASPTASPAGGLALTGEMTSEDARYAEHDDKPSPERQGSLDKASVQRVIRAAFGDFKACYEEGLKRDPKLAGRVNIRFKILVDGHVTDVAEAPSSPEGPPLLSDKKTVSCILTRFQALVFDKQAAPAIVTYPIQFNPAP